MIVSWHDVGLWAIGVLGTTVGNLITLAVVTAVTSTYWFKNFLVTLSEDFNNILKARQAAREKK
jgi:hypothetical protein